ncbi:MAG: hypothetical protein JNK30_11135 [Phenylobacterium sp.]|uniref:hypothetical protein n=1 Tax=Phenylobacterium sp. TaxID=1871053 RepID=UPI001A59C7C5|nr:hypothetical protein [Phenylobacterium sp.]MBL8771925.1 hypothetical protein [Phenylobacterium sp.]
MTTPVCPTCRARLASVRPVRIRADPDSARWRGRVPEAMGFMCVACSALLPLAVTQTRDDAADPRPEGA